VGELPERQRNTKEAEEYYGEEGDKIIKQFLFCFPPYLMT
jgi:hypothetical protein